MKKTDFTTKTPSDLMKLVADKREKLRSHLFGGAGSRTKNVKLAKSIRKDIARILTALNVKK